MSLYEFNVLHFGLTGGSGGFQRTMDNVLSRQNYINDHFMSDILAFSRDVASRHIEKSTFGRLRQHNLKLIYY